MENNLVKLFHDWEIQLLVLLSFTIQIFLFFTGGLRRGATNTLIRLSIWIAYLGADTVAIYALGYLSRQEEDAHSLAFFWAPFLLVHLGGQDTITAFAMEDNNLWLRHLLNLVVQVVLAVYVFWKSIGRHSVTLLVSGALVFIVGVIKYGERTWSLMCARLESLEGSSGRQYRCPVQEDRTNNNDHAAAHDYGTTFLNSIFLMPTVFSIFASRDAAILDRGLSTTRPKSEKVVRQRTRTSQPTRSWLSYIKSLEICLGLMYDDLYTKALGLRTPRGVLLRCISQVCALVAFIVFVTCDRRRYGRVDTAITYSLFMGCLSLEICGLVRLMASPWTWLWTRSWRQKVLKLDKFSWFLLSSVLTGWSQKRPLWSNAMGQYNFYGWVMKGSRDEQEQHKQPRYSFSQQCMTVVRRLATLLGLEKKKIFFISKILDREDVKVDGLLECLVDGVYEFTFKFRNTNREFPNLGIFIINPQFLEFGFGSTIVSLHVLTEQLLCKSVQLPDGEANGAAAADHTISINLLMEECRKLSRYMLYLMVSCPSLLPPLEDGLLVSSENKHISKAMLEKLQQPLELRWLLEQALVYFPKEFVCPLVLDKETLEDLKEVWIRLIVYAASKSRPEQHAAQLARGGELLTFVWLQLRLNLYGRPSRVELNNVTLQQLLRSLFRSGSPDMQDGERGAGSTQLYLT